MTQRNGKISHAFGLIGVIVSKQPYYLKKSTNISYNLYQIPQDIFHRTRTSNPKIYMEPYMTQNCQNNSEDQGGITLPYFTQHYRATNSK